MKTFSTSVILMLMVSLLFGQTTQVPQGFTYQAVARNAAGQVIANQALQVRVGITSDAAGTQYVWEEQHNVTTTDMGIITLIVGSPAATRLQGVASFSAINWSASPLYIKTSVFYQGNWLDLGTTQLWSVPYSMLASRSVDFASTFSYRGDTIVILKSVSIGGNDAGKALLAVTSLNDSSDDPLFEVKRKDGQTVFAVYNDAVKVFVPSDGSKSSKGGFAIGSFDESKKGLSHDYFRVTPDSVRIYINNNPNFTKGASSKGGFAIGSFDESKGVSNTFLNITAASTVDTVGSRAQILWYPKKEAFLAGRVHIGSPDSVGLNSTALGYHSTAMGNWSQAFGYRAMATKSYATAIGRNALASGDDSYALGSGAVASGLRSFALGSVGVDETGNATSRQTIASGPYSVAIGMGAQATSQTAAMAIGTNSTATGFASTSLGFNSTASNHYAVAIGYYSVASNYYAHAFGLAAEATASGSLALGMYSKASGNYASSMGYYAEATKPYSIAVGFYARATGDYSGAFGRSSQATGNNSVAVGFGVTASGTDAGVFGKSSTASGTSALSLGTSSTAGGNYAVGMGYQANASNSYAIAIGYQAKATAANSFSFGNNAEAAGENSFAIGTFGLNTDGTVNNSRPTKTFLSYSVALGMGAQATKKGALAFGVNPMASGDYSTAIGYGPTSSGNYSTAIGVSSSATGGYSTAIGVSSVSGGNWSTAMGYNASSGGGYSIALGMLANSSSLYSTALGYQSTASGEYSTAIGYNALASGNRSISIGAYYNYTFFLRNKLGGGFWVTINRQNSATGDYSVAIGNGNTVTNGGLGLGSNNYARAFGAVALGHSNYADSAYSFAAGYGNYATGHNAFALGESLTAQSANSFVIGTYNEISGNKVDWVTTDPLFVIGNGTSSARSNAMTILKNGRVGLQTVTSPVYALELPNVNAAGTGWGRAYGWATYSDGRVKTDMKDIQYGIDEIMRLRPLSYYQHDSYADESGIHNYGTGSRNIGLVAQEVWSVIPEAVTKPENERTGLWSMSYEKLVPVLIKGIQEQQAVIESQQREIEELRALYESLKSTLQSIVNK